MTEAKNPITFGSRMAGMATMVLAMTGMSIRRERVKEVREPRQCIICGNGHTCNNAFCSADCCRAYKAKRSRQ